jgi:hypothetical protein
MAYFEGNGDFVHGDGVYRRGGSDCGEGGVTSSKHQFILFLCYLGDIRYLLSLIYDRSD